MKRLASFAIALALVTAFAPRAEAQEVRLGLTGGATTTSVGGSSVTLGNWKWGGMAGAFGQYFLARQTYIGLDANWVQKGGNQVAIASGELQDLNLEYIELPLTIGYRQQFDGWESNLYIGLAVSFQLSCKVTGIVVELVYGRLRRRSGSRVQEDHGLVHPLRVRVQPRSRRIAVGARHPLHSRPVGYLRELEHPEPWVAVRLEVVDADRGLTSDAAVAPMSRPASHREAGLSSSGARDAGA